MYNGKQFGIVSLLIQNFLLLVLIESKCIDIINKWRKSNKQKQKIKKNTNKNRE